MDKIRSSSSSNNSSVINNETEIQNMLGKRQERKLEPDSVPSFFYFFN